MIIWGRPLSLDIHELFLEIRKEAVAKDPYYDWLFLEQLNRGDDVFVACPCLENHGGEVERTPSCSIHKETGIVHCFGCDYKDTIPGVITKVLNLGTKLDGFKWILRRYTMPEKGLRPTLGIGLRSRKPKAKYYIPEDLLDLYAYTHQYVFDRAMTQNVIDLFDIGYDKVTKSITIPMRDARGNLLFVKKRPISRTKFHKYHIDEGMDKRDILFGLDIVRRYIDRVKMIYLSEGEFDVMSWYVVHRYSVGLQGSMLFPEQVKELVKVARGIPLVLALDNDKAGERGIRSAVDLLRQYFPLYKLVYPRGYVIDGKNQYKDPNDLLKKQVLANAAIVKI